MRNDSKFVNNAQVCQHHWDGSNWNIIIYDFSNSQLTTGWWIHIFASFSSSSLAYTATVMNSNNLVA